MRTIPGKTVERVWTEINGWTEVRMSLEANRFLRQQPHIVDFLREFTVEWHKDIQQLALYLAYFIWKVCTQGWVKKMPKLSWRNCYQCLVKEKGLWKETRGQNQTINNQAPLMMYLTAIVEHDASDYLNEEAEKISLSIIVKSVVTAFERAIAQS